MIALRREGNTLLDTKYNTTINPLFAAIFVAGLGSIKQQKTKLRRYLSVGVGGLFVAASLTSLATAALTERLERANAVADYADAAAAAKASGFAVGHAVWRNLEHPDLATQFDRLNKLGLLRPDLDKFSDAVQNQLVNLRLAQRPVESPGLKVSRSLESPLALEVVGSPGRDQRGRLPDAVLLLVLPWNGADSVTVYPVAKTSQRDYNGSWWDRHSFGYLSERFDLMRPPDEVERFALIAVWLDSLQMTVLARSILSVRPTPHASVAHDRLIETPPSTSIAVPVVNDEASPAR